MDTITVLEDSESTYWIFPKSIKRRQRILSVVDIRSAMSSKTPSVRNGVDMGDSYARNTLPHHVLTLC